MREKRGTCCEQRNVEICIFFGKSKKNPDMNSCIFKRLFFTQLCTQNAESKKVKFLFGYNLTPCNFKANSNSFFLHLVNYVVLIELNAIK